MNKIAEKIWIILLKGQKPEKSDKIVYFYGISSLFIVFIIFLIVSKLDISSKMKLETQKNKLISMEELKSKESEIRAKYTNISQNIVKLKDKFIFENEVEPIKTSLARFTQKYGGNNISTMPQAQVREALTTKIPVKIGMEIEFASLIKFFHLLEHSNKFINISHVALNTLGEGGKRLRADFTLNLYLLTPDVESMVDNILPEVKIQKEKVELSLAEVVPVPAISKNPFISPARVEQKPVFVWPNFKLEAVVTDVATIIVDGKKYFKMVGDYVDQKKWPDIKVLSVDERRIILISKEGGKKTFELGK